MRRLQVSFGRPVLDGETVTAEATVTAIDVVDGERRATCEVRLMRADEVVVNGTAEVALS